MCSGPEPPWESYAWPEKILLRLSALLSSRALLVKIKRDLENQIRGLLKNVGLIIGRGKGNVYTARVEELIEGRDALTVAVLSVVRNNWTDGRLI